MNPTNVTRKIRSPVVLARATMCVVTANILIMLAFTVESSIVKLNPSCQSQLLNLKTINFSSSQVVCPYNVSESTKKSRGQNEWTVLCRRIDLVCFGQNSDSVGWYLFGIFQGDTYHAWTLTNHTNLVITNLTPSTSYDFAFVEVRRDNKEAEVQKIFVETLPNPNFEMSPVQGIEILDWIPSNKTVSCKIRWIPGPWNSCDFDFIWQSESEIFKKEIRQLEYPNQVVLDKMMYDSNYTLIVLSILNGPDYAESPPATFIIHTPQCIEINSPEICPPEQLQDVSVQENLVNNQFYSQFSFYNVNLKWKLPVYEPLSVVVYLKTEFVNDSYPLQKTVPGNETSITFSNVILGSFFKIRAWAVSAGGPGPPVKIIRVIEPEVTADFEVSLTQKISVLLFGICFIFQISVLVYCFKFTKVNDNEMREEGVKTELEPILLENSKYNVPRDSIILQEIIGEGAFGIVRKGYLQFNGQRREIAVKTLKMKPSEEEKDQLLQELEILHTIGQHDHVVSLVACCTECRVEDMLIVVEYCAHGDLQQYLQKAEYSEYLESSCQSNLASMNGERKFSSGDCAESTIRNGVINRLYDALTDIQPSTGFRIQLSIHDLVSFCRQVADGMAFLAANRIIHRDLAARNVLVTDKRTVKISDFGLSRDIYLNDSYTKTSNGKIPVKWMAIESLMYQKYTSQSDVWSFGVLMWEIMTFGSIPYENIPLTELKELLNSGYRLPCPEITSSELYSIMLSCWELEPHSRPHFPELRTTLDSILKFENN